MRREKPVRDGIPVYAVVVQLSIRPIIRPLVTLKNFGSQKRSILDRVFEFFYSNHQLDQNLKPTRNLCGQLLYIYLCIYVFSV